MSDDLNIEPEIGRWVEFFYLDKWNNKPIVTAIFYRNEEGFYNLWFPLLKRLNGKYKWENIWDFSGKWRYSNSPKEKPHDQ